MDFLKRLTELPAPELGWLIVTLDVSSLYANIPHEEGIEACRAALEKRTNCQPATSDLCDLMRLILTKNAFSFDDKWYLQIQGTAMGTKMAPSYANLFMASLESRFLKNQPLTPLVWWRFIDDIFSIWTHGRPALDCFLHELNSFHQTISFTFSILDVEGVFLDARVYIKAANWESDLYVKPTDRHQYLHQESCHPPHVTPAIPYGQALRLRRICSEDANLEKHLRDLKRHFQARGYDSEAVKEGINRARVVPSSETLTPRQKETEGMNPLVVTYHPCLPPLQRTVGKHTPLLRTDHLQQAIPERHQVVYRRPKNLRDLLVRADVKPAHTPPGAKTNVVKWGTTRCEARGCKTCPTICAADSIKCHTTGKVHPVRVSATCKTTDVIYVISCLKCGKQYVGETSQALHLRMNGHRSDIRLKKTTEKPVAHHFCSPGHKLDHLSIMVVDQTPLGDTVLRKNREARWIRCLKTAQPEGMNIRTDQL